MIWIRDNEFRGEMLLLAYAHTAGGALFTVAGWPFGRMFTAADDQGTRYHLVFRGEPGAGVLTLHPYPLHEIRWLDFAPASGEPAGRIDLGSQIPAPDVIVTPKAPRRRADAEVAGHLPSGWGLHLPGRQPAERDARAG